MDRLARLWRRIRLPMLITNISEDSASDADHQHHQQVRNQAHLQVQNTISTSFYRSDGSDEAPTPSLTPQAHGSCTPLHSAPTPPPRRRNVAPTPLQSAFTPPPRRVHAAPMPPPRRPTPPQRHLHAASTPPLCHLRPTSTPPHAAPTPPPRRLYAAPRRLHAAPMPPPRRRNVAPT